MCIRNVRHLNKQKRYWVFSIIDSSHAAYKNISVKKNKAKIIYAENKFSRARSEGRRKRCGFEELFEYFFY